jgi:uncharacterized membrane protein
MRIRLSDVVLATVAGLVLGAIVHVVVVLRVPSLAQKDAFSRFALAGRNGHAELVAAAAPTDKAEPALPDADPAAATAVCAFDLTAGPVHVTAPASGLLETLSLHARGGGVFYGLTDRASLRGQIDLAIMTQAQLDEAQADEDEETAGGEIRVVSPSTKGLLVVRAVAARPSLLRQAQAAVTSVTCTREDAE